MPNWRISSTVVAVIIAISCFNAINADSDTGCADMSGCALECEYGFQYDNNECEICQCLEPCKKANCSSNEICEVHDVECIRAPCPPLGVCVPTSGGGEINCSPLFGCSLMCQYGRSYDENGCEKCECLDPCKDAALSCTADEVCKVQIVQCIRAPCPPVGMCVNKTVCPDLGDCLLDCHYGLDLDENDCAVCACLDPCKEESCDENQICQLIDVQCIRAPCPPRGYCVNNNRSVVLTTPSSKDLCLLPPDRGTCKAYFTRYHFDVASLQCVEFEWGGCEGNDNNFETKEGCLARCYPQALCPQIEPCRESCQMVLDSRNCSVCQCVDDFPNPSLSKPEACYLPAVVGSCQDSVQRWFYRNDTDSCEMFEYGSCNTNANNFATMTDCMMTCMSDSTSHCPQVMCARGCTRELGSDGCPTCVCGSQCKTVSCPRQCQYGVQRDANGCDTCLCIDPCMDMQCGPGEVCTYKQQPTCEHDMCRLTYVGQCTATTSGCAVLNCTNNCQYGRVKNSDRCDTCICYQPCQDVSCDAGQECKVLSALTCVNDDCEMRHVGLCRAACTKLTCDTACSYGSVKDENDCDTCECFDPCKEVSCEVGEVCERETVATYVGEDQQIKQVYIGQCVPESPCNTDVMCAMYCPYGFMKNSNGCNVCSCYEPCANKTCNSGSVCQPKSVTPDINQPYEYTGECVQCTGLTCLIKCDYGLVRLTSECPMCECYQPCKDVNCTDSSKHCVVKEVQPSEGYLQDYKGQCQTPCPDTKQDCSSCPYGYTQIDECGACHCHNPCQGTRCRDGLMCKPVKDPNCGAELSECTYYSECVVPPGPCEQEIITYEVGLVEPPLSDAITLLNCDTRGDYKPMQCDPLLLTCYCTSRGGQIGLQGLEVHDAVEACFPSDKLGVTLRINASMSIIRDRKEYDFKRTISSQMATYLQLNDSSVTAYAYMAGSIVVYFVVADMDGVRINSAQHILMHLRDEATPLVFAYGGQSYFGKIEDVIVQHGPSSTTDITPFSSTSSPTSWYRGLSGPELLAVVIIVPLVAAALLAVILIICICKCCKTRDSFEPMSNRSSASFDYTMEKGPKTGYENPNYVCEKVQPISVNFYPEA